MKSTELEGGGFNRALILATRGGTNPDQFVQFLCMAVRCRINTIAICRLNKKYTNHSGMIAPI